MGPKFYPVKMVKEKKLKLTLIQRNQHFSLIRFSADVVPTGKIYRLDSPLSQVARHQQDYYMFDRGFRHGRPNLLLDLCTRNM